MKSQERDPGTIHILVVDDEQAIRDVFFMAIEHSGYQCRVAASGLEALDILEQNPMDVVITDIQMPGLSGIDLVKRIREKFDSDVIVMTGFVEDFTYEKIIELGARDFIHKPVRLNELLVRLKRVLNERELLAERNQAFEELKEAYLDTVNRLVLAAEYKDEDTGDHILRMSRYCALLAKKLALPADDVQMMLYASPMHDIGKIGIPDSILLKNGKLTDEEFQIIKKHTLIGGKILANSKSKILESAQIIAVTHHEKWNGTGYPAGICREDIPLFGRIVALADTFDALTSRRPYKAPYPLEIACDIIRKEREKHFDPEVTDTFLRHVDDLWKIRSQVGEIEEISVQDFSWSERDMEGITT
ncbi:MAG: HD domain-containing phosphohydrolase [Desulfococcaceae bacterium]